MSGDLACRGTSFINYHRGIYLAEECWAGKAGAPVEKLIRLLEEPRQFPLGTVSNDGAEVTSLFRMVVYWCVLPTLVLTLMFIRILLNAPLYAPARSRAVSAGCAVRQHHSQPRTKILQR